jgi:hypothetical protein
MALEAVKCVVHNELVRQHKGDAMPATVDGWLRPYRSDKGVVRGKRVEVKPAKKGKEKAKRPPGRPQVYGPRDRITIKAALRQHGLTKGIEFLAKEKNLAISVTLARAVAAEFGLKFGRGRPKLKKSKAA